VQRPSQSYRLTSARCIVEGKNAYGLGSVFSYGLLFRYLQVSCPAIGLRYRVFPPDVRHPRKSNV